MQNKYTFKSGSSETTRETLIVLKKKRKRNKNKAWAFCKNKNNIVNSIFNLEPYFQQGTPDHIPNPNIDFLEWFIGFFEAEGSFCYWFDGKKNRCQIEITQKDPKLMYKVKKNFGFGNVSKFTKEKDDIFYWRYSTSRFDNLQRLIFLFNGNFITFYKKAMFSDFIKNFNDVYNVTVLLQPNKKILLKPLFIQMQKSYWLSGFLEGDGGFWAKQFKKPNKKKLNTGLKIKFYITQKNEIFLLSTIKTLFKIPSGIYQIRNGYTSFQYNRLETSHVKSLILIKNYLQKHPFLGQKKILIKRWIRLIDYKLNDYPLTSISSKKLTRLVLSTKQH
jgi:LAGLIDADG endonuclease